MSFFTIQLRELAKNNVDIGLNDYPIFDESYRTILNQRIIDNFYMNEIGSVSPNLFRMNMRNTMFNIMPKYNKMYSVHLKDIDILISNFSESVSETENENESVLTSASNTKGNSETTATGKSTGKATGKNEDKGINSLYDSGNVNGNYNDTDYADSSSKRFSETESTDEGTNENLSSARSDNLSTGNSEGKSVGTGKTKTVNKSLDSLPQKVLEEFSRMVYNVDKMIINEIAKNDLFFGLMM